MNAQIRPIAMYLPQFHPIPENDVWWGKGFTEWTNVAKAKPLFKGHYQPHLPADLGFYDLRLEDTRIAQAELARKYGIYGFCYYHYWFNGKRILERPFQEVFESGKPNLPFMLCWANEHWTRIWDGSEKNMLLAQKYSDQDDIDHIRSLIPAFKDSRYITVDGKPVFAVYKSTNIPDIKATIRRWRNETEKEGIKLYLCRMDSFGECGSEYLKDDFDSAINFEPFGNKFEAYYQQLRDKHLRGKFSKWYINYKLASKGKRTQLLLDLRNKTDYNDYVNFVMGCSNPGYNCFPGITPMWDNSARKKENYFLFKNTTPAKYKEWLESELDKFQPYSKEENFIFINAWNEWAEGNHLEPCSRWGLQYLEATRDIIGYSA